jgi:hypothetical protein
LADVRKTLRAEHDHWEATGERKHLRGPLFSEAERLLSEAQKSVDEKNEEYRRLKGDGPTRFFSIVAHDAGAVNWHVMEVYAEKRAVVRAPPRK